MNNLCASASVVHQLLQNTRIQNSQERFHVLFYFILSLRCAGVSVRRTLGHSTDIYCTFCHPMESWSHIVAQKAPCNLDY